METTAEGVETELQLADPSAAKWVRIQGVPRRDGARMFYDGVITDATGHVEEVRGLAVILALFGSPSVLGAMFGVLLVLMLYPIVMATTLMVGLTDTWLDLRARRLTRQDNEKH